MRQARKDGKTVAIRSEAERPGTDPETADDSEDNRKQRRQQLGRQDRRLSKTLGHG